MGRSHLKRGLNYQRKTKGFKSFDLKNDFRVGCLTMSQRSINAIPQENSARAWQSLGTLELLPFIGLELVRLESLPVHMSMGVTPNSQSHLNHTFSHSTSLTTSKNTKFKDNVSSKLHLIVKHLCKLGIE